MTRFVIDAGIAIRIVEEGTAVAPDHRLVAPGLLRSQVLDRLYGRVRTGELSQAAGLDLNARFSRLKVRYLGDAVLRCRAWALAAVMGLASTYPAEYVALTELQADALITDDEDLAFRAAPFVTLRPFSALSA